MDWRDNLPCESERAGGGWVVTGGLDNTIKIWDFSLPTLSTKPSTTLFPTQPVHAVAWHPSRPTEVASAPLPSLSVRSDEGSSGFSETALKESSWKHEIEVWDTRRVYFPKVAIKTEEPISSDSL